MIHFVMLELVKFHILELSHLLKAALLVVVGFGNKTCFATRKEKHQESVPRLLAMNITICRLFQLRKSKIKFNRYMLFVGRGVSRAQHRAWPIRSS